MKMVFILFLITTILSGYIDGQNTYTRNDFVCNNWVCSVIQYQLQIVGNVYNLTSNNIKSNVGVSECYHLDEFKLSKVNDAYNLIRGTVECRVKAIPLDYFFTSDVSSTVDFTCGTNKICSRYRYDRIGSSVTSTRIGSCNYNYCTYCNSCIHCTSRGPWQLNLTSMMLERITGTEMCNEFYQMSIVDFFTLDLPISSSTVTTTEAKDSPITSSTVTTTAAKDSPITSSTVTTKAQDSPFTSSTVTIKAQDSTSKKSQSTLIWSFGTITVNLISCLLINGLK